MLHLKLRVRTSYLRTCPNWNAWWSYTITHCTAIARTLKHAWSTYYMYLLEVSEYYELHVPILVDSCRRNKDPLDLTLEQLRKIASMILWLNVDLLFSKTCAIFMISTLELISRDFAKCTTFHVLVSENVPTLFIRPFFNLSWRKL